MPQLALGDLTGGRVPKLHRPMRKLSIGALCAMVPVMAACSGAVTSGPAATVTVAAEPMVTAVAAATPETTSAPSQSSQAPIAAKADTGHADWIEYVRNRAVSGSVRGQTDDELMASAKKMCDQMRGGDLFEEAAINLGAGLPKPYETDMQLILGTGTAEFCPEFLAGSGTDDAAILQRLRTVAPAIAHNPDAAILEQARTACPPISEGPAGAAATIAEARRAWGHDQGYKFIFISARYYCPTQMENVIAKK